VLLPRAFSSDVKKWAVRLPISHFGASTEQGGYGVQNDEARMTNDEGMSKDEDAQHVLSKAVFSFIVSAARS
jgi:hypothetical protein